MMTNKEKENRIRIRPDVNESLNYYIHENAAAISGVPGARMDKSDVVSEIVMNFLAGKGHYPPKVKLESTTLPRQMGRS